MAWGYGPNEISAALFFSLLTQAALFVLLVSGTFRKLSRHWSPIRLCFSGMLAISGSTALYNVLWPVLGVGVTTGLVTLGVTLPATVLNSIILTARTVTHRPTRSPVLPLLMPLPVNVGYWALLLSAHSA